MSLSLNRGVPLVQVSQKSGLCLLFFFSFRLAVGQLGGHVLHPQADAARTVVQEKEQEG